jgi:hypothetical protein
MHIATRATSRGQVQGEPVIDQILKNYCSSAIIADQTPRFGAAIGERPLFWGAFPPVVKGIFFEFEAGGVRNVNVLFRL